MEPIVYLNGEFLPRNQAKVPVMERGFLFGDGVYEVLPSFGGKLFRLSQHLDRLNNSLRAIHIQPPHTHTEWENILTQLVSKNPHPDSSVYLQVTRGVATSRDHAIPPGMIPTIFAMASVISTRNAEINAQGIVAITQDDFRWERCNIKAITLLANVLLKQAAADEGAFEAILIRNGLAVEGAASNLFIIQQGTIITPPISQYLLPGITRDLILELALANDLPHAVMDIPVNNLMQAEEIWMTSSVREIMPVINLNNHVVGNGTPGPHWEHINQLYQTFKANMRAN